MRGLSTDYGYVGTAAHCIRLLDMNWYLMIMWLLELWVDCNDSDYIGSYMLGPASELCWKEIWLGDGADRFGILSMSNTCGFSVCHEEVDIHLYHF